MTVTSYQVVTGLPNGISHPSFFLSVRIDSPIGWPEPSSGCAETALARSNFRSVIRPTTGSISVGDPPHSERLLRRSFHRMPSFSTRDPSVNSNLEAREIGSDSRDVTAIVQNLFRTSADNPVRPGVVESGPQRTETSADDRVDGQFVLVLSRETDPRFGIVENDDHDQSRSTMRSVDHAAHA